MAKFTLKKINPTGKYKSFYEPDILIKYNRKECGTVYKKDNLYKIRLMVYKKDITEDGNPNCKWKWIALKGDFNDLDSVKDFLNKNSKAILDFNLHLIE